MANARLHIQPDHSGTQRRAPPSLKTCVKIFADDKNIYTGVKCHDPEPEKIIYFSKIHDARLGSEDMIKFVFDTNLDGRTGYIFAINPAGTRYDALGANFG